LRKVEYIPPEELQTAIVTVIRDHIGTDEKETSSSVAKMLGVSNSRAFRAAIHSQIEQLTARRVVEDRSGKLFFGSESVPEMAYRN
jgi:hypothetical protein